MGQFHLGYYHNQSIALAIFRSNEVHELIEDYDEKDGSNSRERETAIAISLLVIMFP